MDMNMESTLLFEKMMSQVMEQPSSLTDDLLFEDNFANDIYMKYVDESTGIDLFAEIERDEKMYLDESQPINNKIDFSINDFVASIASVEDDGNIKNEQLLMEFNSILNEVDLPSELTPPQTPPELFIPDDVSMQQAEVQQFANIPNVPQYEIFQYQQQVPSPSNEQFIFVQNSPIASVPSSPGNEISIYYENSNQSIPASEEVVCHEIVFDPESIISSPTDIQRELEVVDELVRAHSRHNSDYDDDFSMSGLSSPRSEYSCSSSSSGYSQYDDEPVKKKSSGLRGVTKKRTRGYGRNPEEKKFRKKEQNKNAATRYRIKKKQEVEIIMDEEKILMDKNRKLTTTYKDTKREVKYLKSLLRDLFKARGFI